MTVEFRCGCHLLDGRYPVGCELHTEEHVQYVGIDDTGRSHAVTASVLTAGSPVHVPPSDEPPCHPP